MTLNSGRGQGEETAIKGSMETMLGISLYSYRYLKLAKILCLSYYFLCLLINKIGEEGKTVSARKPRGWGEEGGDGGKREKWPKQCMYI
jgi:hypothetical protein